MTEHPSFHLLIVEDDSEMREGLRGFFEIEGYRVTLAGDGEDALSMLRNDPEFDLVILDVMLPKKTGFDVLREVQVASQKVPVVLMTALGEQEHIIRGFKLGADDYVVKPFSADVLSARVKAILSRSQPPATAPMDIIRFGDVTVNFSSHEAQRGAEDLHLTALEFDLLRYLIQNEGRTVSRRTLIRDVWGVQGDLITRTVDRHVASLRKKIEPDQHNPQHIHTVYGTGYRFKA